jgi:hypothetical protein
MYVYVYVCIYQQMPLLGSRILHLPGRAAVQP